MVSEETPDQTVYKSPSNWWSLHWEGRWNIWLSSMSWKTAHHTHTNNGEKYAPKRWQLVEIICKPALKHSGGCRYQRWGCLTTSYWKYRRSLRAYCTCERLRWEVEVPLLRPWPSNDKLIAFVYFILLWLVKSLKTILCRSKHNLLQYVIYLIMYLFNSK